MRTYEARCDFCGRFMPWARWSQWNCFAGYPKAWCHRLSCVRAADRYLAVVTIDTRGLT